MKKTLVILSAILFTAASYAQQTGDNQVQDVVQVKQSTLQVMGLVNASQAEKIDKEMAKVPGIVSISSSFGQMKTQVNYDESKITEAQIIQQISFFGFAVSPWVEVTNGDRAAQYADDGTVWHHQSGRPAELCPLNHDSAL